ncbi:hypothetical protein V1282_005397 [Nitrobacteraceae bacterium AZCC 2146]
MPKTRRYSGVQPITGRLPAAERQKRIERARAVALKLVRHVGFIERDGELVRISEFRHNELLITYYSPRPPSKRPHKLTIRYDGKTVFVLEWDQNGQLRSTYKPGAWGSMMLRLLGRQR